MEMKNQCLGCQLANKELLTYVVYENEQVTCILDHEPFNLGHTLILPKHHYLDVESFDVTIAHAVMEASMLVSKALKSVYQPDGISICQNGGIFNELTHYHMHVIPRYQNQNFSDFYLETECGNNAVEVDLHVDFLKLKEAIEHIKSLTE